MKVDYKFFPYPILANDSDDIINSSIDFENKIDIVNGNLKLVVKVVLKNETIERLIKDKKAQLITQIKSNRTRYRDTIKSYDYNYEYEIPSTIIGNKVDISSFIVTTQDLKYTNTNFAEDYIGDSFSLAKGSILAYGDDISLDIEKVADSYDNLPSIFSIVKDSRLGKTAMNVIIEDSKIKIALNEKAHEKYRILRQDQNLEELLATIFIIPALVHILTDFEALEENYSDSNWFISIKNALYRNGIKKLDDVKFNALKYSQLILGDTFSISLDTLKKLSLGDDE